MLALFSCSSLATQITYQDAQAALQRGDYLVAEGLFKQYLKQKPSHPQSLLNLAQIQLKLNKLDLASFYLKKLSQQSPWRALSFYYLGYIAEQQGSIEKAIEYYESLNSLDPPDKLRQSADQRLAVLASSNSVPFNWWAGAELSYGSDTNPAAFSDEIIGNNAFNDTYQDIGFYADLVLDDWDASVEFDHRNYNEQAYLSYSVLSLSTGRGVGNFYVSGHYDWVEADLVGYQTIGLETQRSNLFDVPFLTLNAGLKQYLASSNFDYLDGQRLSVSLDFSFPIGNHWLFVSPMIYKDARKNYKTELGESDYSPLVAGMTLGAYGDIVRNWSYRAFFQSSHYQWQGNHTVNYSSETQLITQRNKQIQFLSTTISYQAMSQLQLELTGQLTNANDSIDRYAYTSDVIYFTVRYQH